MRKLPVRARAPRPMQLPDGEEQVRLECRSRLKPPSAAVQKESLCEQPPLSGEVQPLVACPLLCQEQIIADHVQYTPVTIGPSKKRQRTECTVLRQCLNEVASFVPVHDPNARAGMQQAMRRGDCLRFLRDGSFSRRGSDTDSGVAAAGLATLLHSTISSLWMDVKGRDALVVASDDPETEVAGTGTYAVVLSFSRGKTHAALSSLLWPSENAQSGPIAIRIPKPCHSDVDVAAEGHLGEKAAVHEAELTHFCSANGLGPLVYGIHFARCRDFGGRPKFYPLVLQEKAALSWTTSLRRQRTSFAGASAATKTLLLLARAAKADILATDVKLSNMLLMHRPGGGLDTQSAEEEQLCLCDFDPQFMLWGNNATGSAAGRLLATALLVCAHAKNDTGIPEAVLSAWQEKFAVVIDGIMGMEDDEGVQWVCSFRPQRLEYCERQGSDAEAVRTLLLMMASSYFYGKVGKKERQLSHAWPSWSFGASAPSWAKQMRDFALSPRSA